MLHIRVMVILFLFLFPSHVQRVRRVQAGGTSHARHWPTSSLARESQVAAAAPPSRFLFHRSLTCGSRKYARNRTSSPSNSSTLSFSPRRALSLAHPKAGWGWLVCWRSAKVARGCAVWVCVCEVQLQLRLAPHSTRDPRRENAAAAVAAQLPLKHSWKYLLSHPHHILTLLHLLTRLNQYRHSVGFGFIRLAAAAAALPHLSTNCTQADEVISRQVWDNYKAGDGCHFSALLSIIIKSLRHILFISSR